MDYKRLVQFVTTVIFSAFLSMIFFDSSVFAATDSGIKISPTKSEYLIKPGTLQSGKITITNNSDDAINVEVYAEEFTVINQNYDYAFTSDSEVVDWISFSDSSATILSKESMDVEYNIGVPLSAEPGGRYVSIFVSSNVSSSSQLNIKQRLASLLYITVDGKVTKLGELLSISSPWLITNDVKSTWSATIRNKGTTHFHCEYKVELRDLFSRIISEKTGDSLVLPASVRIVDRELPGLSLPGIYWLEYRLSMGDLPAIQKKFMVLYMPVWFCCVLTLGVSIFVFEKLYKKRRNKKLNKSEG